MSNVGKYEEILPCGGKLIVSKDYWEISYYFSGPDLRYNGEFVKIPGSSITIYINAFNDNWNEYESLKKTIPSGGQFTKVGKMGMSIRLGGFATGVCLKSYHMPVSDYQNLQKIIAGYRYAIQRSRQIQDFLASL